jgi:menaquinone-9 beta-reductase
MPARATKRGAQRTPLGARRDCDVLVCGASFAGLAVARELRGSGMRVLMLDRYEIGERQTSACAMPTLWLEAMDLMGSLRQTFDELLVHTHPRGSRAQSWRWRLPWSFSTFDYREICALLHEQADPAETEFETATITGRDGHTVHSDRGSLSAPLIVDALGWRRVLSNATAIQPPNARLSRGLEVHPAGTGEDLELWIDHRYVRSGYAWSFPAREEVRIGAGSFWAANHVKEPTVRLAEERGLPPEGYQGNWIPHQLRAAVEDGVFFAGDSAGHCLPLTAEGIRTALYFGLACARELRAVHEGRGTREQALARYGAFSDGHARKYEWLLRVQRAIGQLTPTPVPRLLSQSLQSRRFANWTFAHYLAIAPPSYAKAGPPSSSTPRRVTLSAAA